VSGLKKINSYSSELITNVVDVLTW
ncbi:uncharacterized protein METZ01_LOCUS338894, partial [marine metagenome]